MTNEGGNPRWGNQQRKRKGDLIVSTITRILGGRCLQGQWVDIGCGSGGISSAIASHVSNIIGLDPEPWKEWHGLQELNSNLMLRVAVFDREDIPLAENSADMVICNQVYEHVNRPEQLIQNIHRVLRSGGCCYFAGPNLLWPVEPHIHLPFLHWIPRHFSFRMVAKLFPERAKYFDAYAFTYWKLKRLFKKQGFKCRNAVKERIVAELVYSGKFIASRIVMYTPSMLFDLCTPIGPSFIFILEKKI